MHRNTYVEIDTNIIGKNVQNIINKYKDYKYYIGVVKGNCYGHGSYIAKTIVENGVNYLAVSSLEEAIEIRKYVEEPILCLEPIDIKHLPECVKYNVTITLSNYEYYKKLLQSKLKGIKVHLKINTGFNRLGLDNRNDIKEIYDCLIKHKDIKLEGIYTHFATTGILDKHYDEQVNCFLELTKDIDLKKIKIVHLGRSVTLELHPKLSFANGVRLGVLMYGIKQPTISYSGIKGRLRKIKHEYIIKKNNISKTFGANDLDVKTAFKLKSEVMEIQKLKKGEYVGYGYRYQALKDTFIAIIPVGYADGLDLRYTNCSVKINDCYYNIVGVVNMGMITVEVDQKVSIGDMAYIIDNNVKQIAKKIGVTPYVVMTAINSNVPRIYLDDKKTARIEV